MKIRINGQLEDIDADSLDAALQLLGYGDAKVATAVNGEFVPEDNRAKYILHDGDRLEVLAPMQGG